MRESACLPFPSAAGPGIDVKRPSRLLLWLEARAGMEYASLPLALPALLRLLPRGDGHAVLVLPGLLADDRSTRPLRRFLRQLGYDAHGWGQGRNLGPRNGVMRGVQDSVERLHADSGRKISLIGWSLGGVYAREAARSAPERVRQVITLGTPLYGQPLTSTHAWETYKFVSGQPKDYISLRVEEPPPVPCTSIYSRTDGVVGWGASVERPGPLTDNIEIDSASHLGLGFNPLVLYALGDRLGLPEDGWKPFEPRGLARLLYPFRAPLRS